MRWTLPVRLFSFSLWLGLVSILILVSACGQQPKGLKQDKALNVAWEDLRPYTSSQDRVHWAEISIGRVYGRDVVDEFTIPPLSNCPGPEPPENQAIRTTAQYWLVRLAPRHLVDPKYKLPTVQAGEPLLPEPYFREALLLVDPYSAKVVARKFICFSP